MASNISQNGTLTTSNTQIKLRGNSGGVPLAHADVDGNFELLRLGHNSVVSDLSSKAASGHSHSVVTTTADGFMSAADKVKLNASVNYSLPAATEGTRGGIKVGTNLSLSSDTLSVPAGTNSVSGVVKYDNSTIKKNGSGQLYVDSSVVDSNTTYTAGTGISISGTTISSTVTGGGGTDFAIAETDQGAKTLYKLETNRLDGNGAVQTSAGYMSIQGIPDLVIYLNKDTGTSNTTTQRKMFIQSGGGGIAIEDAFSTITSALQYLNNFLNKTHSNVVFVFQTDITDPTWDGSSMNTNFLKGVTLWTPGSGTPYKWTVGSLNYGHLFAIRGRLYLNNISIEISANAEGDHLFSVWEGGYLLTSGNVAIELGSNVYLSTGVFGIFSSTFYGEHQRFEIKNSLSSINLCQPIFAMRMAMGYTAGINIHSGQFHQCRMLAQSSWIQYHSTLGNNGTGGAWRGTNISATDSDGVGNWWQETNYNYPTGYVDLRYPAFRFEGAGNTIDWGGMDTVTTDVMRYSSVVGQTERFDHMIVGVGMANPTYSNASTESNAGIVFNWDSPTGPATVQVGSIAFGAAPYYMNQITYPWGANGTVFSHTNYRSFAYPGVSAGLPKKTFTIIT